MEWMQAMDFISSKTLTVFIVLKCRSISVKFTDFDTKVEISVSNGIIEGKCCIEMGLILYVFL